jgi:hypothetical protein
VIVRSEANGANTPVIGSVHSGFADASISAEPFPNVIVDSLFDEESCAALLDWFENDAVWEVQETNFYLQHRCSNLNAVPAAFRKNILDPGTLAAIVNHLQEVFHTTLNSELITVSAHKLLPGQGIGIHTDQPEFGTETHRLVLHLCREYEDSFGGHLILFHRRDPDAIATVVRPLNNVAVGFELSDRSFHAVSDISSGVRYSLVFGFWVERKDQATTISAPVEPANEHLPFEEGAELITFLEQLGAREVPHSARNLLKHLVGSSQIVARWGGRPSLCRAALFHSVYGTTGFNKCLFSLAERPLLQSRLGAAAERLVFLFCYVDRLKIYNTHPDGSLEAEMRDSGEIVRLTRHDVRDLRWLIAANVLEQAPYATVTTEESVEIREELLVAADDLPTIAHEEITRAFG